MSENAIKGSATPQQMQALTNLCQNCGVDPADLWDLCHVKYGRRYYQLSHDDAMDLTRNLARLSPSQSLTRAWISNTVDLLRKAWIQGDA